MINTLQHCSERQRHRHDIRQHRSRSSRRIVWDARSPIILCASRLLGHGQRGAQCSYRLLALHALIALFRMTAWLCLANGNLQGPTKYCTDLTDWKTNPSPNPNPVEISRSVRYFVIPGIRMQCGAAPLKWRPWILLHNEMRPCHQVRCDYQRLLLTSDYPPPLPRPAPGRDWF